ncbi:MAG: enoyl-CoA hydratase-related protein [Dethiobacteria bacterium]|jgi:6-oxo-cyclohex-1-ene-carbonyl-CoA hydrolase
MSFDWIKRAPKESLMDFTTVREDLLQKTEPPRTIYEKRPLVNPKTKEVVDGLYTAYVILDNERQGNSYDLDMLAGAACAFQKASRDPSVVAVVLTGAGDRFFCTGGNVPEYSEHMIGRPMDCQQYMQVYWDAFNAVWTSSKPFIRRVQGMSIGGGEEISGCCDLTVASDTASFGQVGPAHGSTAMGGAVQFKSINMTIEDAIWNVVGCAEQMSAYKMLRKSYIHRVEPVLKQNGEFIRNPEVITDKWIEDGQIVYGEYKTGDEFKEAKALAKSLERDTSKLDQAVDEVVWTFANLYPQQVGNSLNMIRAEKKASWERTKAETIWWWAANASVYGEFDMGMTAFNTAKQTGTRDADIIKLRQLLAKGRRYDAELFEEVMPKPKK